jgi:hypothetical protein
MRIEKPCSILFKSFKLAAGLLKSLHVQNGRGILALQFINGPLQIEVIGTRRAQQNEIKEQIYDGDYTQESSKQKLTLLPAMHHFDTLFGATPLWSVGAGSGKPFSG